MKLKPAKMRALPYGCDFELVDEATNKLVALVRGNNLASHCLSISEAERWAQRIIEAVNASRGRPRMKLTVERDVVIVVPEKAGDLARQALGLLVGIYGGTITCHEGGNVSLTLRADTFCDLAKAVNRGAAAASDAPCWSWTAPWGTKP